MTLEKLYNTVLSRKNIMPEGSYVASLFRDGDDRIIQKVGEEATEVVIAAKNTDKKALISESADLIFHLIILLVSKGIRIEQIYDELDRRHKI